MKLEFNEIGNLKPDKYEITFSEAKEFFVDSFTESETRQRNWTGFCNFLQMLINFGLTEMQVWVDGSFVTNKLNPNDVDCVIYIKPEIINSISKENQENLFKIFLRQGNDDPHDGFFTDPYILFDVTDNLDFPYYQECCNKKDYWENWWGHDRSNNAKGFLVLTIKGGACQ